MSNRGDENDRRYKIYTLNDKRPPGLLTSLGVDFELRRTSLTELIHIRVSPGIKKNFLDFCRLEGTNPSEDLRAYMAAKAGRNGSGLEMSRLQPQNSWHELTPDRGRLSE